MADPKHLVSELEEEGFSGEKLIVEVQRLTGLPWREAVRMVEGAHGELPKDVQAS